MFQPQLRHRLSQSSRPRPPVEEASVPVGQRSSRAPPPHPPWPSSILVRSGACTRPGPFAPTASRGEPTVPVGARSCGGLRPHSTSGRQPSTWPTARDSNKEVAPLLWAKKPCAVLLWWWWWWWVGGEGRKGGGEWTGLDWTGLDWTGVEWSGVEWSGVEWSGEVWCGGGGGTSCLIRVSVHTQPLHAD